MKNKSKTIKTLLFASLIAALILPFSGMQFVDASSEDKVKEKTKEKKQRLKDVITKVKLEKIVHKTEKAQVDQTYNEYFSVKDSLNETDIKRTKELKAQLKAFNEKGIREYQIDDQARELLVEAQKTIEDSNLPFVSVSVDTKLRAILVGFDISFEPQSEKIKDKIESLIDTDYAVEFDTYTDHSCTSQTASCDPIIGGLKIVMDQGFCTLGLPVMQGTTAGYITAGHCFIGHTDQSPNQGGTQIGSVTQSQNSGSCDCAFIDKSTTRSDATAVWSGYNTQVNLTSKTDPVAGEWVVLTGAATVPGNGIQTGQVNYVGATYNSISGTVRVSGASATSGDSGAPYYNLYDSEFFGIHKGGNSSYNYMIPWSNIVSALSVS